MNQLCGLQLCAMSCRKYGVKKKKLQRRVEETGCPESLPPELHLLLFHPQVEARKSSQETQSGGERTQVPLLHPRSVIPLTLQIRWTALLAHQARHRRCELRLLSPGSKVLAKPDSTASQPVEVWIWRHGHIHWGGGARTRFDFTKPGFPDPPHVPPTSTQTPRD